ncbi:CD48 antigen [Xenopus laevis]|uniref:CD48 antigen n=2 Tax=Xenopus laevis TaxID=8355 RepID=A0A8J0TCY2_XENLA|nr:CD48 antigen [Xenopus laevis]
MRALVSCFTSLSKNESLALQRERWNESITRLLLTATNKNDIYFLGSPPPRLLCISHSLCVSVSVDHFLLVCVTAGGDIPLQVTGRVGETVTLTPHLSLTYPINTVIWMFNCNGKIIILAEFREQKFIRVNNNYFMNRLEVSNSGTSLQIRELRMEDSGVFTALILVNGEIIDIYYNLNVAGGDIPLQVTGRVGETVTLTPRLSLTHPNDRVTWTFRNNGKRIILAEFREQKFIRVNRNYFLNRLEGSNSGTSLQIRELRMEDSGVFTALILVNGEMREISYNLTVYESIPTPVIEKTLDVNSTDLCHLHCSVPSNSTSVSYSWIYRDKDTDILYANGSTISVSLKDKTLGTQFICLVQNPAHTNNVSVPLYLCAETQTETQRKDGICWIKIYIILPVLAVLSATVIFVIFVTV